MMFTEKIDEILDRIEEIHEIYLDEYLISNLLFYNSFLSNY